MWPTTPVDTSSPYPAVHSRTPPRAGTGAFGAWLESSAVVSLVSLVVTDIVGSTGLWAEHEATMRDDLEQHDRIATATIIGAGGTVFKHTGDGMMAAFDDPLAAVTAAAELQRAIGSTSWANPNGIRLRVAVHTGSVHARDGDLYGTAVNRAARLVATCPPGAVVTSASVASLLADRTLDELSLHQVGTPHLRGFARPEPVYAVVCEHLSAVAELDPDPTVDPQAQQLPRIDDEIVGRSADLTALWEAVHTDTLVTLVGVGGMGKTRLALEVAAGMEGQHPDGVWWCDLSTATSVGAVAPVVLDALGARQLAGRTATDSVVAHLDGRQALVVLDNCEHMIDPVRELVTAVHAACPDVRLLATSREALGLAWERQVGVGSLDSDDAVRLFHERARRVRPDLGPAATTTTTSDDDTAIRAICEQLDGIPLAIELAAARCRSLTPAEIADRLHDRYRLLRGGRATSERHRTLQAAVAWSYSMLDDDERDVFDAMAVFAGGSLLDGIAAVTDLDETGHDEYDVLDALDRLIARSLVVPTPTALGTRYRQLETLRQFAEDRLIERATIDAHRDRHLHWMLDLTRRWRAGQGTSAGGANFDRYVAEVDNLRLAVAHASASGSPDAAFEMLAGAHTGLVVRPTFEALEWIDPIAATTDWSPARAVAAVVFGSLRFLQGEGGALDGAVDSVPAEHHDDPVIVYYRALARAASGDADGTEEVLDAHEPRDASDRNRTGSLRVFAHAVRTFDDPPSGSGDRPRIDDAVHDANAEIVASVRASGDEIELAFALTMQGFALAHGGRPESAIEAALEADRLARMHGAGSYVDLANNVLALAFGRSTDLDDTRRLAAASEIRERLVDATERRSHYIALASLAGTVLLFADRDPVTAHLLDQVRLRSQPGFPVLPDLVETLGADTAASVRERAGAMSVDDAIRLAIDTLDHLIGA